MRLRNKVALITGAASGIGKETALLFAREGAKVVLVDVDDTGGRRLAGRIKRAGGFSAHCHADVSNTEDCATMVRFAEETFGKLDILFNNAGIMLGADDDAVNGLCH